MAIAFNTYGADPIGGFIDGFTGMDKYLVNRRSLIRDQRMQQALDKEQLAFSRAYYEAQQDPSKRPDLYTDFPIMTAGMLTAQSKLSGGASGIFGGGGASSGGRPTYAPGTVVSVGNGSSAIATRPIYVRNQDGSVTLEDSPIDPGQQDALGGGNAQQPPVIDPITDTSNYLRPPGEEPTFGSFLIDDLSNKFTTIDNALTPVPRPTVQQNRAALRDMFTPAPRPTVQQNRNALAGHFDAAGNKILNFVAPAFDNVIDPIGEGIRYLRNIYPPQNPGTIDRTLDAFNPFTPDAYPSRYHPAPPRKYDPVTGLSR